VPNIANVTSPPHVRIRVGPAVEGLSGTDIDADTERIMTAITKLLPAAARRRHDPTEAELARTYPAGHAAD
jgi:hypothetical protein